jgi:hypothetical protein
MRRALIVLLATTLTIASAGAQAILRKSWTFENDPTGSIAGGFTGAVGEWKVVQTDAGRVLAQLASSPGPVFNVALATDAGAREVDLAVRMRAIAGDEDQGGGLIWRARDAKNYYVARYNPLEDNFRVYKVVDGKRTQLGTADVKHHDGWYALRVTMEGDHIACDLDGTKWLDVRDATFPDAGAVGLWSKSDARTQFDDLTLSREVSLPR